MVADSWDDIYIGAKRVLRKNRGIWETFVVKIQEVYGRWFNMTL